MSKIHIKSGDTVMVISGTDKGKKGKVLEVSPKEGKVIVEKIKMISKHVKPRKEGQAGGIIKGESPLYSCKVMLVCPKCGVATRVGHAVGKDGNKVRVCLQPKCGHQF